MNQSRARLPSIKAATASSFGEDRPRASSRARDFEFEVKPASLGVKQQLYEQSLSDKDYAQMKLREVQEEHRNLLEILGKYSEFLTTLVERKKVKKEQPKAEEGLEALQRVRANNQRIIEKYQQEIRQLSLQDLDDPADLRDQVNQAKNRITLLQKEILQIKREIKLRDRQIVQNQKDIPRVQGRLQEDYQYSKRYNQQLLQKKAKLQLLSSKSEPRSRSLNQEAKSKAIADKEKEYEELVSLLQRKKLAFQKNFESKRRAIMMTEEAIARQEKQLQQLRF